MKKASLYLIAVILLIASTVSVLVCSAGDMDGDTITPEWGRGDENNHYIADGVRITVVDKSTNLPVSTPFDWTNYDADPLNTLWGGYSKLHYTQNLAAFDIEPGGDDYISPDSSLPEIIDTPNSSMPLIKEYFTRPFRVERFAEIINTNYTSLTSGDYELLVEPVAYFKYLGVNMALTGTEAALYDTILDGDLSRKIGTLTRQNLPLSLFLVQGAFNIQPWRGDRIGWRSNSDIIAQLGVAAVKFTEDDEEESTPGRIATLTYLTDTDVIISTKVTASGREISPDRDATVTFAIYNEDTEESEELYFDYVLPPGGSERAWVKWRTPSDPAAVDITISASHGSVSNTGYVW